MCVTSMMMLFDWGGCSSLHRIREEIIAEDSGLRKAFPCEYVTLISAVFPYGLLLCIYRRRFILWELKMSGGGL